MPRKINYLYSACAIAGALILTAVLASAAGDFRHPQAGQYAPDDFDEPTTCAMCHPLQFEQWSGTMHAHSTDDPFYSGILRLASEDLPGIEEFCENCHSPIAVLTGEDPLDPASLTGAAPYGISCDFCHTVSGYGQLGNAGYVSSPGEVKRGPFGSQPPIFHTVEQSPLHDSAEFCGICHDVSHPANGLVLEGTYTEFLNGPYPAEGFKCQTCHMTPGLVKFEAFPAPIANGAEERDHIWTHWFVGANAWMTELLGEEQAAQIARERLSKAATVEIGRIDAGAGQRYFEVTVTNTGAGHMLPTGVTEERQIWLEVEVFSADGEPLAHFGAVDDQGRIAEDTMILGTVFGDADGQPTHKIWRAESVLSDRRIAPRASDSQAYHLSVVDGPEPARIRARLWYRGSSPEFVDQVFAAAAERVEVPHILMAEVDQEAGANGG